MIKSLKLVNFRNFSEKEIFFDYEKNLILGDNGKGKTNILEALSLLSNNSINSLDYFSLTKEKEKYFYIETEKIDGNKLSIFFDKDLNKKRLSINGKNTTKKIFGKKGIKSIIFSPIDMNLMYLGPSLRRLFLDSIISNCFDEYKILLKKYKEILKNRNIVLKNIGEKKIDKSQINFWDDKFVEIANEIYIYRFKFINYINENIINFGKYFKGKVKEINFFYVSKIKENNIKDVLIRYLKENIDRDIILKKTYIGPHLDDFDILLDKKSIKNFASRGETKSVVIGLKLLEARYIEEILEIKPIILIDDLLSELDDYHKLLLIENIKNYQTFITSIKKEENINLIVI